MIAIRYDKKNFNKILRNAVDYSMGFLEGTDQGTIIFNTQLAKIAEDSLNKYIDAKARANPQSLHHVYEWNKIGKPSGRLFKISGRATKTNIIFSGEFLPSSSTSNTSDVPFVDKANIMENNISVTVSPVNADYLAFEVDGQQVFTMNSVFIENPGGDEVAGSFGRTIEEFFESYFTTTVLKQSGILDKLSFPKEFADKFSSGTRMGRISGRKAGMAYMSIKGGVI